MSNSPTTLQKRTSPFRYGIGMFGTSIPINMFKSFAAIFYVDMLGLDMKKYSLVLFIYTFVDAIDNPVYGFLSDRTRTKWGRRRPWLIIGTPLLILGFLLFFNVPAFIGAEKSRLFIYMLLMYIMTGTLDSLINANYGALFPEIFKTDEQRAKTNAIRQICQLLAMVISIALTPMITDKLGYSLTSIIYGVIALAVILFCVTGCHENMEYEKLEKPNLIRSIIDLVKNGKFWLFGIVGACYSAAFALISQAIPFYVKYTLGLDGGATTLLLGVVFAAAVVALVVWSFVIKKISVLTAWRIGLVTMAVGFVPLYFASSMKTAIPIVCIMGVGVAACLLTMDCIGAKIMDDDFARHGIKREGTISSLIGVMNRLNGLYTSLAFYLASEFFGFVNGDNPGDNPATAAKTLLCVFPAVAMILASVFSFFLRFRDEKKAENVEKAEVTVNE